MMEHKTLQHVAEAVREGMYARDHTARAMGITVDEVGPGTARTRMVVRPDMVNGHDICHGGMIFTLADTAFAYACNSRNRMTVAQHCAITFLVPAARGDVLIATARELIKAGRNGVCDVIVSREDGETIATFRGNSVALQGEVVPGLGVES